jgi:hypothetical protein
MGGRIFRALPALLPAALAAMAMPLAAQPFTQQIAPFALERSDGSALLNPFSGGLAQPRVTLRDFDRDGLPDLFALNPDNRLRLYRNEGNLRLRRVHPSPFDGVPVRSWFRFADIDADGDDDLYTAGSRSEVLFLRNDATQTAPAYRLPGDTLKGADGTPITMQQETVPSLVDIDGDGDLDLFSGNLDGSITFYENTGTPQAVTFTYRTSKFAGILVVSNGPGTRRTGSAEESSLSTSANRHGASVLDFVDLDSDGDLDLLFGDFFTRRLLYFPNAGTARLPSFSMTTLDTAFGPSGDLVESEGFNQPTSGDIDGDGDIDVVVSSLLPFSTVAPIILYENRGTVTTPLMRRSVTDPTGEIDIGSYAAPASIDDRERHGILVGSTAGALTYYEESRSDAGTRWRSAGRYPIPGYFQTAPTTGDLDGDGDAEVVIGEADGRMGIYGFTGNSLVAIPSELDTVKINQNASPTLADLDSDGDLDLLVGTGGGLFIYLKNNGSPTAHRFERTVAPAPLDTLDVGSDAAPRFFDLDHDGDQDLIIGSRGGGTALDLVRFFINQGGVFIPSASHPEIVSPRNPVPLYRILPEGRYLFVGNGLGGITALRDEVPSSVTMDAARGNGVRMVASGDNLGLEWSGASPGVKLRIIDLLGSTILEHPIPTGATHIEIDTRSLPPGLYLWQIGPITGKLIR